MASYHYCHFAMVDCMDEWGWCPVSSVVGGVHQHDSFVLDRNPGKYLQILSIIWYFYCSDMIFTSCFLACEPISLWWLCWVYMHHIKKKGISWLPWRRARLGAILIIYGVFLQTLKGKFSFVSAMLTCGLVHKLWILKLIWYFPVVLFLSYELSTYQVPIPFSICFILW